ncbi:ribonucleoside transporter [Citrobacter koseri]|uniref:Ribonucleoside transporter n=1 Tax=Citrobacter koseri TaxID=545 RepID=A0A2X2YSA0_CITKO|nr:ribonucleoside transporter [Citrobacter koseri]
MLHCTAFLAEKDAGNEMSARIEEQSHAETIIRPNWSAVFAVAFCVACLITVEFLPVSLLTPMAQDLGISGRRRRAVGNGNGVCRHVCQPVYHPNYSGDRSSAMW